MVREICRDEVFLAQKAEAATEADLSVAEDLLEALIVHKDGCVGMDSVQVNAFIACVLGGFQTFYGPVIGAYIIAVLTNLFSYYISSVWGTQLLYLLIIVFLCIRPVGLIGKKTIKKV